MKKARHTTKDIAKLASVSRGTVDRVLHSRGKVSDEARQKVEKVLKEIDYQPNVLAKALQGNKEFKIAVLMPSPAHDVFWKSPSSGIEEAQANTELFDVSYEQFFFNRKDKDDFKKMTEKVTLSKPHGIIFAPFFFQESLEFLKVCKKLKIPCITFNTHIESDYMLSFIGQNLHQSGQVAAGLIQQITHKKGTILIVHFNENISNAMHMQEKEAGFSEHIKTNGHEWKIQSINITEENEEGVYKQFDDIFENYDHIVGAFVTTSKTYKLAQYLKHNDIDCKLVGYDLIEENINYLQSGVIDFLIRQNPKQQALSAATLMADHLILKKEIPKEILLPLDIISKENYNSYL